MVTKKYYMYMLGDTTIHANEMLHPTRNPSLSIAMHEGIQIRYEGNPFNLEPYDIATRTVRYNYGE